MASTAHFSAYRQQKTLHFVGITLQICRLLMHWIVHLYEILQKTAFWPIYAYIN